MRRQKKSHPSTGHVVSSASTDALQQWKGSWNRPLKVDPNSLDPLTVARMTDHNVRGHDEPEAPLEHLSQVEVMAVLEVEPEELAHWEDEGGHVAGRRSKAA